ncbi:phosphatidic acid phosphatase type 2/haloperoxidase [Thamnocephalis sphaerospora]|uniref:Phosphatidic acid phosphatase type 2/haloperoxidase n=1 Tax=Thamnocephalis sphaerospora TaxID=78915 RepID=A0A4P9XPT8_9FUNG|nr:phosphatidic acid phosphatase type 2/haloperoxidase [Thamnocephalis sphaerospora]|eukprot:RKP08035.1 phosphatidic acid phosphatase type 2/haloperoxidase [Thamnocephalis sphaerospora]
MSFWKTLRQHQRLAMYRLLDWLAVAVIAIGAFMLDRLPAFHRQFSLDDPTIKFPMATKNTVTSLHLTIISVVVPAVLLAVIALGMRRSPYDLHQAYLGLGVALSTTSLFVHIFKNFVGRPRPDFLDRCRPSADAVDPVQALSSISICTQTNLKILYDGMKSFPSGHAAYSFAGLAFVSFYMAGKLRIFDERGFVFKPLLCLMPLIGAALVAISRVCDYRHHWQDVTIGSILGFSLAYFAYRLYYPSLAHSSSMHPFAAAKGPLFGGGNGGRIQRLPSEDVQLRTPLRSPDDASSIEQGLPAVR